MEVEDSSHRFVGLVKIVHVSIQDLHEQLNRGRLLHTRISDPESTLEAFEHSLPVSIELKSMSAKSFRMKLAETYAFVLPFDGGNRRGPPEMTS